MRSELRGKNGGTCPPRENSPCSFFHFFICPALPNMSSPVVSFPVPSIAAGPQSIVNACEDAELTGASGAAGSEPRFVEVRFMHVSHSGFGTPRAGEARDHP